MKRNQDLAIRIVAAVRASYPDRSLQVVEALLDEAMEPDIVVGSSVTSSHWTRCEGVGRVTDIYIDHKGNIWVDIRFSDGYELFGFDFYNLTGIL